MAVFTLAVGIAVGWACAIILAASPITSPISEAGVQLLAGLGGAMIGVVGTYLGMTVARRHQRRPDDE